jgi:transposase
MGMGKRWRRRELRGEERRALERVAHSRTAPARQVERAQVVLAVAQGEGVSASAERFHVSPATVYAWWHRFEVYGVAGLQDHPRGRRPPTSPRELVNEVVPTARTAPQTPGQPCASWTLDRLAASLAEAQGILVPCGRLWALLIAEGLGCHQPETAVGEPVDPDVAETNGPASTSLGRLLSEEASPASTRWIRQRPTVSPARRSTTGPLDAVRATLSQTTDATHTSLSALLTQLVELHERMAWLEQCLDRGPQRDVGPLTLA